MTTPFAASGEWLKAALHTHSTVTDGTLAPGPLAAAYAESGFDVLAVTDHWKITEVTHPDLVTVPAAELGFDLTRPGYPGQTAEFLAYGISDLPEDPGGDRSTWRIDPDENWEIRTFPTLADGVTWTVAQGGVAYVAHPYWNGLHLDDVAAVPGLSGLEVFNSSAEHECGRGDSSVWWDHLLDAGHRVSGIATDDQHYPLFELGRAWTWLRCAERSPAAVLEALRTGAAWFSEGPVIHDIAVDGDAVEVSCSPAVSVRLQMAREYGIAVSVGTGGRRQGRVLADDAEGHVTRVRFTTPAEGYRRIVVVDKHGRRAWSNPF